MLAWLLASALPRQPAPPSTNEERKAVSARDPTTQAPRTLALGRRGCWQDCAGASRIREGTARSRNPAQEFCLHTAASEGCPSPEPLGITVRPSSGPRCPSPHRPGSGRNSPRTSSRSAGNTPRQKWPPAGRSAPGRRRTARRWERTWGCGCPAPKTPAGREQRAEAPTPAAGSGAGAVPGISTEPSSSLARRLRAGRGSLAEGRGSHPCSSGRH